MLVRHPRAYVGSNPPRKRIDPNALKDWSRNLFDSYSNSPIKVSVANKSRPGTVALRLLAKFDEQGAVSPETITYHMLADAVRNCVFSDLMWIVKFATYIGEITERPLFKLAASWKIAFRLIDINSSGENWPLNTKRSSLKDFNDAAERFINHRRLKGYSTKILQMYEALTSEFLLFLEANSLEFSLDIAKVWCKCQQKEHGFDIRHTWPFLHWIDAIIHGHSPAERLIFDLNDRRQKVPDWAKQHIDDYIQYRSREPLSKSTFSLLKRCSENFCRYADSKGCSDIREITRELVKQFNLEDEHKTVNGKNACNLRVFYWLRWLYTNGRIEHDVASALPTNSAAHKRPVKTLEESDQEKFEQYCNQPNTDSKTYYRDIALVKLMRYVGLRASEAAALKFTELDLNNRSLNLVQPKTNRIITKPVPVHVLNSIVEYIEKERPQRPDKTTSIFLSVRAPFHQVTNNACARAFLRILGRMDTHTARRTFATELMGGGNDPSLIAHTIGHTTNKTIKKYLNTDEKRMVLCTIPLTVLSTYSGELL